MSAPPLTSTSCNLGNPEDTSLLVSLRMGAKSVPGGVWGGILNADFQEAYMESDVGDRAAVDAIPGPAALPTPREDNTPPTSCCTWRPLPKK